MTVGFKINVRKGYPGRQPYRQLRRSKTTLVARKPAGDLRNHFILRKPVEQRTGTGTRTITFQDVDDDVWGDANPLQGIQLWYAQQFAPKADMVLIIRFRNDVRDGWQLQDDNGWQYIVRAVPLDINGRGTMLALHCQTLQAGAL